MSVLATWAPRVTRAAEPRGEVAVTWTGPASCPRNGFDEALARSLADTEVDVAASRPIVVHVDQRGADHWHLELVFSDEEQVSRTFEGRSCAEVADAAAWVVAIAVDPTVADRAFATEDEPNEAADQATVPAPPPDDEPTTTSNPADPVEEALRDASTEPVDIGAIEAARPRDRLRVFLGAEVGPDGGSLPGVGALVRARLGLGGRSWRVDLTGAIRTPTRRPLEAPSSVDTRFDLWLLGIHAGPVLGPWPVGVGTIALPVWIGFEVGQVTATASGFDDARTVRRPFLGPTAGAALAWAMHPRVALRVGADLLVAPWRHEFFVGGLGRVHRTGWVAGRGTVGIEVRLGRR